MARRQKSVRLSEREHRILEATAEAAYDGDLAYGAVVERACRQVLAEDGSADESEVSF